jgi:hypothetical protein
MLAMVVLSMPIIANAAFDVNRGRNVSLLLREQSTTQPITLRSVTAPNANTGNPGNTGNWVLEIKVLTSLLTAGATVKLDVKQLGDPITLQHVVNITPVSSIGFGASVQGVSTATVTVPMTAVGSSVGGVFSVNLFAEVTLTEAQTSKVTRSSVSATSNFNFPESSNRVVDGSNPPQPNIPTFPSGPLTGPNQRPPVFEKNGKPKLKMFMENYYDWYVGYEPTQKTLNGDDDEE